MEDTTHEPLELIDRVAAIDIAKAGLVVCVRVPHEERPDRRRQEVREYSTLVSSLPALADWLRRQAVTLVAMEATSEYWKPVYYLLEAEGFTCWPLNAKHVKNVPGRPKTDKLDAVWLAKVVERGMCRPSLVHPKPIRQLRDLTRYRRTLVRERTRVKQRVEKLLEAERHRENQPPWEHIRAGTCSNDGTTAAAARNTHPPRRQPRPGPPARQSGNMSGSADRRNQRTGCPAARKASFTSPIRNCPKWNTDAASTASAPASTAGGKSSSEPAPPLAITGTDTAARTARIISRS
ncbi:hypothetical protein FHR32_005870 [Streptosporangium album]|uniref:Transposase IS110-like N-terminal domain-containing protein n=1 Tax=Streptosporangium album TaxID=47479 RepID=A0A7W7S081_9ACTN|nr:hypothetical protein [Streptosporangium album]